MQAGERDLQFEKAARIRDEIDALREPRPARRRRPGRAAGGLPHRPQEGLHGLQKVLGLPRCRRERSRAWTSPISGGEDTVASLVPFIDGLPFKPGYRRFKIKHRGGRRRLRLDARGRQPALPHDCREE